MTRYWVFYLPYGASEGHLCISGWIYLTALVLKLSNVLWYFPEAPYDFEGNENEKTWAIKKEGDVVCLLGP